MKSGLFRFLYYFLSFTWGLPANAAGAFVSLFMLLTGHRPHRFAGSIYFVAGKRNFGGFSYGIFFIKDKSGNISLMCHEYGHSLQNCLLGPFMLIVVNIPSTIRYWYRHIRIKAGRPVRTAYDSIWFEGQATRWGSAAYNRYYTDSDKKPEISK